MVRKLLSVDSMWRDALENVNASVLASDGSANSPTEGSELLRRIVDALRSGGCPSDRMFDRFLPAELQAVSSQHWTPLEVATRAAEWINQLNLRTVVDIGSGVGKFCVAAALTTHAHFTGLEQRARLVRAATSLAQTFGVADRVHFVHGTLGVTALPQADAYYLYNPFGENLLGPSEHLDEDVELGQARYRRDIASVRGMLMNAPFGTYLITYNGFGGTVPAGYQSVRVDRELPNVLRAWRKVTPEEQMQLDQL